MGIHSTKNNCFNRPKEKIEKVKTKNLAVYIACMVWGKDPDEIEEKKGPVPGRDIPISENALKGLL